MKLQVNLSKDSYPIYVEKGCLSHVLDYINVDSNKLFVITDSHVHPLYFNQLEDQLKTKYKVSYYILEAGEQSKNLENVNKIYSALIDFNLTRTDTIIALGGGVVGDLAGFVASTYLRGVKFIQIPTSLLAQVDSSVGGKVAVDLPQGKNLVGAFKHPKLVLIDPITLKTLPEHFISDGMGEVIKYGCIFDKDLFNTLASYTSFEALYEHIESIIYQCCNLKRIVVEKDLFDFGDRLSLNFGHTLAHAIETYYHYSSFTHGQAVAIGMVSICEIAEEKGLTKKGIALKIKEVCEHYHLPTSANVSTSDLKIHMTKDKKNIHSKLSYVLLKEIGGYYIYPSDLNFIEEGKMI